MRAMILMLGWLVLFQAAKAEKLPKDKVLLKQVMVMGSMSKEIFRRIEARHHPEIVACYKQALEKKPDLAGTLTVDMVVSSIGKVTSVSTSQADSTFKDPTMENCLLRKIEAWEFPSGKGGGICKFKVSWLFG